MKKLVISKNLNIDIDVYFEFDGYSLVASTKIEDVYKDGEVDGLALIEYETFVEECANEIRFVGFEILDESESRSSVTSHYFTLASEDDILKDDIKYLIFLRISDHKPNLTKEQKQWIREQRDNKAEFYKQPKYKDKQRWKVRQVVVNGGEFYSYDDAVKHIIKLAESWLQSIK